MLFTWQGEGRWRITFLQWFFLNKTKFFLSLSMSHAGNGAFKKISTETDSGGCMGWQAGSHTVCMLWTFGLLWLTLSTWEYWEELRQAFGLVSGRRFRRNMPLSAIYGFFENMLYQRYFFLSNNSVDLELA